MIAANDPLGGGFDGTGAAAGAGLAATLEGGAAFVALDALLLDGGFDKAGFDGTGRELVFETGRGTALGAGETVGFTGARDFATTGRVGILVSGLDGWGSGSSAFLFVPPTFPLVGGTWRTTGGFRSSFLGTAAGTGEAGAWDNGG